MNAIDRIYILPLNDSYSENNYQKLTEMLIEQGIAPTDTNGAYRSVYDILKDLADKWKDMSDSQSKLIEDIVTECTGFSGEFMVFGTDNSLTSIFNKQYSEDEQSMITIISEYEEFLEGG